MDLTSVSQDNTLTTFNFGTTQVRTARTETGEPLFCLADVCKCLELENPTHAANQIKEEFGCPTLNVGHIFDSLNREQEATFITEPQLYFVMMRSRSEHARSFRQWICNEVLPSIRKTGAYNAPAVVKSAPDLNEKLTAVAFILGKAGIEGNQLVLSLDKVYKHDTGDSALALTGTQLVAPEQKQLLTPTQLGEPLGLTAREVNKKLLAKGYQIKTASGWEPTAEGVKAGAVLLDTNKKHSNGTPVRQLKWPSNVL